MEEAERRGGGHCFETRPLASRVLGFWFHYAFTPGRGLVCAGLMLLLIGISRADIPDRLLFDGRGGRGRCHDGFLDS